MDSLPVNATDLVIFVVLLISALLAFARGFVHELLSIVGWIGAIFATIYGYPYLKPFARDLIT
ncbi:MAG: CvpA family protein, partial [Rhodospirillales bacterium]